MERKLSQGELYVCYLSKSGDILEKSSACLALCARRPNEQCVYFKKVISPIQYCNSGFHRGPTVKTQNNEFVDTIFLLTPSGNIILHHRVGEEWLEMQNKLNLCTFTRTEKEIAELLLARFSNHSICELKSISQATLKSHINRIYQELPVLAQWRKNQEKYEINHHSEIFHEK